MNASDAENRLRQLTWMVTAAATFILAFIISMTSLMVWQAYRSGHAAAEQKSQLQYLCSTTGVLDDLVVAAANQLEENFKNGTYSHLRDQGIISQANIDAARDTLAQYRASHERLAEAPC